MSATTVAAPREVREWLLAQGELPEGVTVGQRGRLSTAAKEHFTASTGREVAAPQTSEAPAE
jgi:hypothetical protein